MSTILKLTIISTNGDLSPQTIAIAEQVFETTLEVDGNRATGDVRLPQSVRIDDLVATLRQCPGVTITDDEVVARES
jgi:hypothetical protein